MRQRRMSGIIGDIEGVLQWPYSLPFDNSTPAVMAPISSTPSTAENLVTTGIGGLLGAIAAPFFGAELALGIGAGALAGYLWNQNPNATPGDLWNGIDPVTGNPTASSNLIPLLLGGSLIAYAMLEHGK